MASGDWDSISERSFTGYRTHTRLESLNNVGRSNAWTCRPSKWFSRAPARYCWPIPGKPLTKSRGRKTRERSNSMAWLDPQMTHNGCPAIPCCIRSVFIPRSPSASSNSASSSAVSRFFCGNISLTMFSISASGCRNKGSMCAGSGAAPEDTDLWEEGTIFLMDIMKSFAVILIVSGLI